MWFTSLWIFISIISSYLPIDCTSSEPKDLLHLSEAFLVKVQSCTAIIIADNWLLSAAHCFSEDVLNSGLSNITKYGDSELDLRELYFTADYYAVKPKALPLNFTQEWTRPMEEEDAEASPNISNNDYWRKIEKIIIHKNFKSEALSWQGYDIALIKLELRNGKNVPAGKIMPICLPSDGFNWYNNASLWMAGYGRRRIPHCLTNLIGPEKFEVCGREETCSKDHRTERCTLEFLDDEGSLQTSCITNTESPSAKSKQCIDLHKVRPDLKNQTVHIFASSMNSSPRRKRSDRLKRFEELDYTYLSTCYPAYSDDNSSKGWCTIRQSGVSENKRPEISSGWGFCSNDDSQKECNGAITSEEENSMPHEMTYFNDHYCFEKLEENLKVEQPDQLKDFLNKAQNSKTNCVGKIYEHSFDFENFVDEENTYQNINSADPRLQQKIFDDTQNNIRPHYVDGGPGCFGDSGGPLWRQVTDEKTKTVVPVLVGVFSYLLWGTCHGAQEPKFYGQVASIKDWIYQYVPIEQTCEYSTFLTDHRPSKPIDCVLSEWSNWSDSDPQSDYYNPSYSDSYSDYDSDISYDESIHENLPITSNCSCIRHRSKDKDSEKEVQFRRRSLIKEGTIGGKFCQEKTFDVQQCICSSEQQIDCKWGEYSPWSECSKSCGSGIRRRIRVVVQNASIGGKECTGLDKEAEECKILDCPQKVDCKWGSYGEWTSCSATCGNGLKFRTRKVLQEAMNDGKQCLGCEQEIGVCKMSDCLAKGNENYINGMWAAWSRWSQCTQSCGIGERIRSRKCSNPSPENNGEYCIGPRSEKEFCLIKNCAADSRDTIKDTSEATSSTTKPNELTGLTTKNNCIKLDMGQQGTWSKWKYCKAQAFASQLALRHEIFILPTLRSESFALNGIGLLCTHGNGGIGSWIISPDRKGGSWKNNGFCQTGEFAQKARLQLLQHGIFRMENSIVAINIRCGPFQNSTTALKALPRLSGISKSNLMYTTDWKECNPGSFICGIRTKLNFQSHVTGVELKCCTNI